MTQCETDQSRLSQVLQQLPSRLALQRPSVGDVLVALGNRAAALILLAFAIPAIIPTPGIPAGALFGSALAFIGAQMAWGSHRLRLPAGLARLRVKRRQLERVIDKSIPLLERIEGKLRRRATTMTSSLAFRLLGVVVFVMAILIALPIPFGNTLPGISIIVLALGLAHRDGLAITAGLVIALVASCVSALLIGGSWWLVESYLLAN